MTYLPRAAAAAARAKTDRLVRALRDVKPPLPDWDAERFTQAAVPGRPGVLSDYRRQHEFHYDFTPLKNGVPCGPAFHVYPTCPNLGDAGYAAVKLSYRMCDRDINRYHIDMLDESRFESKAIFADGSTKWRPGL